MGSLEFSLRTLQPSADGTKPTIDSLVMMGGKDHPKARMGSKQSENRAVGGPNWVESLLQYSTVPEPSSVREAKEEKL